MPISYDRLMELIRPDLPAAMAEYRARAKTSTVDMLECVHRGEMVGKEPCKTCSGNVMGKVFACAIHGRCTRFAKPLSVRSCRGCSDRRAT